MKPNLFITLLMSLAATQTQAEDMAVTDGFDIQKTTYYPYGEPTVEPKGQRYLFGGKEREHAGGRNSYDFGARNLTPYGVWSSPDPMATKFYNLNPYSYCAGDPINNIDYNGCDTLSLSQQGYINVKTVTDDDFDILQAEDGSILQVDKSFMQSRIKTSVKCDAEEYKDKIFVVDCFELSDEKTIKELFEFVVMNTNVEWSSLTYVGGKGMIGTSHEFGADASVHTYVRKHIAESGQLLIFDHSHPDSSGPSGADYKLLMRLKHSSPRLKSYIYYKGNFSNPHSFDFDGFDFEDGRRVGLPDLEVVHNR